MMRWAVGLLLLANISLFVWKIGDRGQAAVERPPPPATDAGVPGLVLLREIGAETATAVAPAPSPGRTREEPAPSAGPAAAIEKAREVTASPPAAAPSEPEPEPAPRPVATPEPSVAEPPAVPEIAAAAPAKEPVPPAVEPPPVAQCVRIGPFSDEAPARAAAERLRAQRVFATLAPETVAVESRYWVYLPPASSREEALGALDRLQEQGFDSFVVGSGEYRNAISLGVFSTPEAARRLQVRVREQGWNPRTAPRERSGTRYWLDLGERNSARFGAEIEEPLRRRFEEAETVRLACP